MTDYGPTIGKEDLFEGDYVERFRLLVRPEGEFVTYERDRAALDLGVHLTVPAGVSRRVNKTRIWFQLKGVHRKTLPLETFERATELGIVVGLDQLKFWFASPEPIYLVVYVEAADTFLAEDVQEIVYRQWGEGFLAPGTFLPDQHDVTIKIRTNAVVTVERVRAMRSHQSMRIDGPFFRGRPLGHRLDPLRCCLGALPPPAYVALVQRLLTAHDYRVSDTRNTAELFGHELRPDEHAYLTLGRLYTTFEWVPQMTVEFGVGPRDDFRTEGDPQFAQGPVAAFIHGDPRSRPTVEALHAFSKSLAKDTRRLLVFANTDDDSYFGSFFGGLRGTTTACMPQLLRDLGYSLLTVTVVYLEFRDSVSWRLTNYLW